MNQAFSLHFCILEVTKNWAVGKPEKKASMKISINSLAIQLVAKTLIPTYVLQTQHLPEE